MLDNPYATQGSNVVSQNASAAIHLYSPTQAAAGAFLGGPVGLVYFLRENFMALGNEEFAKNTLIYGVLLLIGLAILIPLVPEDIPSLPFTIAYVIAARYIAEKCQVTKQGIIDAPEYEFHSNWRVAGLGLLCMVGSAAVVLGPVMLLVSLGLIE